MTYKDPNFNKKIILITVGPGFIRVVLKVFFHDLWPFIKHYIFKLGFLNQVLGFFMVFGNFERTFYRYIKLKEVQKNWIPPSSNSVFILNK